MVVKKQSAKTAQLYAYSFDRKTWQGDFNSREEAIQAAKREGARLYLVRYRNDQQQGKKKRIPLK